jgi:hypothetical protein
MRHLVVTVNQELDEKCKSEAETVRGRKQDTAWSIDRGQINAFQGFLNFKANPTENNLYMKTA